jgi:hypothetical protein
LEKTVMAKEIWQTPEFQERALLALLMLRVREALDMSDKEQSKPENSVEALLFNCGFSNKDITDIAGTAKSTVTDRLKAAGLK